MSGGQQDRETLRRTLQKRPGHTVLRLTWVALNAALGAASGGFLGWGPLGTGAAATAALAVLGGLIGGGLWAWQQIAAASGQRQQAQRRGRALILGGLAIFAGVGSLAACQSFRTGALPPLRDDYLANFDHLDRAMARSYSHFELKDIDWDALTTAYRPQAAQAQSDEAYHTLIAEMLAELDDAHTGLVRPYPSGGIFAYCEEIEGEAVVTWASLAAQDVGLERGAVIRAVGGMSVAERIAALERQDPRLTAGSTAQQRRARGYLNLLRVPVDKPVTVTFQTASAEAGGQGEPQTATLSWAEAPEDPYANLERGTTSRRLPSGVGIIRIPTFASAGGRQRRGAFDEALDGMLDAPGLIIDLRGNGGGASFVADAIAGRLVTETVVYARERYRSRLPRLGWRTQRTAIVRPRGEPYTEPVVLLIDSLTMSTGETFVLSLADTGRARTVGRTSAGATGNPVSFRLVGGGRARYSVGFLTRLDGRPLEGHGITPDVETAWTVEDVQQGRDPDIAAAERLSLGE